MTSLIVRVKKLRFREVTGLEQYRDIGYKDIGLITGNTRLQFMYSVAISNF